MIPVLPSQLRTLVPEANAPLCLVLRRFWQWAMQRQILRLYCFTSDGSGDLTLTNDFKADICNDPIIAQGCDELMSTTPPPLSGAAFRALIPAATDALCLKTQPSIINFMEADTRDWEWLFVEESGVAKISPSFRSALCTLGCLGGGGTVQCPGFIPSLTLTPGDAKVTLDYVGQGIQESGYQYEVYSAATQTLLNVAIAAGTGSALTTGTMTSGASFTYQHTGLTNGQNYFYHVRARKDSGCAWRGTADNLYAIPSECRIFNLNMAVMPSADTPSKLTIRVVDTAGIGLPAGMTVEVYRGTTAGAVTTLLSAPGAVIGDSGVSGTDANGKVCMIFEHTDPAVTCAANDWYFTVKLKEAGASCSVITVGTQDGSPDHYPVPTGVVSIGAVVPILNQAGQLAALRIPIILAGGIGNATLGYGKFRLETQSFNKEDNTWTTRGMLPWGSSDGGVFGANYTVTADLPVSSLGPMMEFMYRNGNQVTYMLNIRLIPHVIATPCGTIDGVGSQQMFPIVTIG
jgi:hypothetical protein